MGGGCRPLHLRYCYSYGGAAMQDTAEVTRSVARDQIVHLLRRYMRTEPTETEIVDLLQDVAIDMASMVSNRANIRQIEPQATRKLRAEKWLLMAAKLAGRCKGTTAPNLRHPTVEQHEAWLNTPGYRSPWPPRLETFGGPPVDGADLVREISRRVEALRLGGHYRGAESAFNAVYEFLQSLASVA